jgi:hypothetical protein
MKDDFWGRMEALVAGWLCGGEEGGIKHVVGFPAK